MQGENKRLYNVAVVGATGNIGSKTLEVLVERNFPYASITAVASARSANTSLNLLNGTEVKVRSISDVNFENIDIAFFCAGSAVSAKYAPQAASMGSVVIDKTSFFRMGEKIPLVVPEININCLSDLKEPSGIIACPNCVAIPLSMSLYALMLGGNHINNVVVSTYQSVSGAGRQAVNTLRSQSSDYLNGNSKDSEDLISPFPRPIAFNAIPQIDTVTSTAYTGEEDKIMREVSKITGCGDLNISVTCVRVPTFVGHGMSVYVELSKTTRLEEIEMMFKDFPGLSLGPRYDYTTPVETAGHDEVFIGRLRRAGSGYLFWVVTDNLRKGAALNGLQIAEHMINIDPTLDKFKLKER